MYVDKKRINSEKGSMKIENTNRLLLLDCLRGFALLGILISNIPIFSFPIYSDGIFQDGLAKFVKGFYHFFVTGKFFVLFSFVFGYGFSILLENIEAKGGNSTRIYFRRLLGLFVLGIIHAVFLFEGDILVSYSILGVFLYFVKDMESKWKKMILVTWILSLFAYGTIGIATYLSVSTSQEVMDTLSKEAITNHLGDFGQNVTQQLSDLVYVYPFILLFNVPTAAMMFVVGLWAGKRKVFATPEKIWNYFSGKKRYLILGGVLSNGLYVVSNLFPDHIWLGILPSFFLAFGGISFALLYVLALVYLISIRDFGESFLVKGVSRAGSMSLTNYLLQSILCSFLFDGWGLGWYATLHPGIVLCLTLPIYGVNVIFSSLWKQYFPQGPMEWLLRKWTYA